MGRNFKNIQNQKSILIKKNTEKIEKTNDNLGMIKIETVEQVLNIKNKDLKNVHVEPADEQEFEDNV